MTPWDGWVASLHDTNTCRAPFFRVVFRFSAGEVCGAIVCVCVYPLVGHFPLSFAYVCACPMRLSVAWVCACMQGAVICAAAFASRKSATAPSALHGRGALGLITAPLRIVAGFRLDDYGAGVAGLRWRLRAAHSMQAQQMQTTY